MCRKTSLRMGSKSKLRRQEGRRDGGCPRTGGLLVRRISCILHIVPLKTGFSLLLCELLGSNSRPQAWWQVPLPGEPSCCSHYTSWEGGPFFLAHQVYICEDYTMLCCKARPLALTEKDFNMKTNFSDFFLITKQKYLLFLGSSYVALAGLIPDSPDCPQVHVDPPALLSQVLRWQVNHQA